MNVNRTKWALMVVALLLAGVYLSPLYWMYLTSIKTASEVFANPPTFWPNDPNLAVYAEVWMRRAVPTYM